jgi:hypothetical protein
MVEPTILNVLRDRNNGDLNPQVIHDEVLQNPDYMDDVITALGSDDEDLQTYCAEALSILSEEQPETLCPYIDVFINNLTGNTTELRCYAVDIIGNLACVDESNKIPEQIRTIARYLTSRNEQVQNRSVRALGKIAQGNPDSAERIFNLLISHKKHFSGERICIILESFNFFSENQELHEDARRFIEHYINSSSRPVKEKALEILTDF